MAHSHDSIPPLLSAFDLSPFGQTVEEWGSAFVARLPYLIAATVVVLVFFILARLTRRGIVAAGRRSAMDVSVAGMLARLAGSALLGLGILIGAVVVFPSFHPGDLIAGLGITSIVLGFALKDILQNLFAGVLLLMQKPFRAGDQIRVKDFEGQVEEITLRATHLKTYDGERVLLPNGDVYGSAVLVRTAYDKRRIRLNVGIRSLDAVEKARTAIQQALGKVDGVLADPAPFVYVGEFIPAAINFAIYYWVRPEQSLVLAVNDRVATAIKRALDEAGVALA
jgi:small conductance mechanosensitive channel